MKHLTEQQLLEKRRHLLSQLSDIGDFRPGNLYPRRRKCGKSNCRCAQPGQLGHESWELARKLDGRSHNLNIPKKALEETRQHVSEYRRFRELVDDLIKTSDALCSMRIKGAKPKKGAAQKTGKTSRTASATS